MCIALYARHRVAPLVHLSVDLENESGRHHSSGQLRYWHRGADASGLPRLNEEGAEIVVTLEYSLDHRSTVTFHAPQHSNSRLGTIRINEADCSPQVPLYLYVQARA